MSGIETYLTVSSTELHPLLIPRYPSKETLLASRILPKAGGCSHILCLTEDLITHRYPPGRTGSEQAQDEIGGEEKPLYKHLRIWTVSKSKISY